LDLVAVVVQVDSMIPVLVHLMARLTAGVVRVGQDAVEDDGVKF